MATHGIELRDDRGARIVLGPGPPLRGGEASVYEGEDGAGRKLAIKVAHLPGAPWLLEERAVLTELAADPATGDLVAHVRGGGCWGDRPFLVLDWYPCTLERWLDADPPPARRLAMAARLAHLVAALHAARPGLVHRDLKPSNVLLDAGEHLRLADFGASRVAPVGETVTRRALGTPGYAPPEHALPGPQRAGRDTDVYALAATLFHVLVGRAPAAPRRNAQCLTPDGERLLLGLLSRDDADTERWLDSARMTALDARDRRDLAAAIGRDLAFRTLLAALEPVPARRRVEARELAAAFGDVDAVIRARAAWSRRRIASAVLLATVLPTGVAAAIRLAAPAPVAPPMVRFEPGTFTDPATGSSERIERPFLLGAHEVTQGEWREVTGEDPSIYRQNTGSRALSYCDRDYRGISAVGADLPVVCVNWFDAVRFANRLSTRDGLVPAYAITLPEGTATPAIDWLPDADGYRLPTVQEWAYAATLGAPAKPSPCRIGNLADPRDDTCDDGFPLLAPVGRFLPTAQGVHDLFGNVSEWAWDATPDGDRARVGLNFDSPSAALEARNSHYASPPGMRALGVGLRLARTAR